MEFIPLSGPSISTPLTQHIPEYNEPLQKQEFSGHTNETYHISPLHVASPPKSCRRHEFGGTSNEGNQYFHAIPEAAVAYFVRGAKNEKRNEPQTSSESSSEDDVDRERDDESTSDEGDGENNVGRAEYRIPSFYTQINVANESESGPSQSQLSADKNLRKGLRFRTKKDLQIAVKEFSVRGSREYIVIESSSTVWSIKCAVHENCKWRLRGSLRKKHGEFEISKYEGPHTCTYSELKLGHKQLDSKFIANHITSLVEADPSLKISVIVASIKRDFGYKVSYWKAWHAKQKAIASIFGDWVGSYANLPSYMAAMQRYNPGTIHELSCRETSDANQNFRVFDKNFWAFSASIEGFVHCRPVISIDGTHLRGKYKGKLLIAMALDANGQLFPLAFGFAEEESIDSWGYFLTRLWYYVVKDREGICLISDRHQGILAFIKSDPWFQEPRTYHRFCLRHVCSNLLTKFKDRTVKTLFWRAATANQERKFIGFMSDIKKYEETHKDKKVFEWLNAIPLEKWTLLYDGGHRYGTTSTNVSEAFNGVLLGARNLPITACVNLIYNRVVNYFCIRRDLGERAIADPEIKHVPTLSTELQKIKRKARHHNVRQHNKRGMAGVTTRRGNVQSVDITTGTCSCGKWTIYKYPCSHALAVYAHFNVDSSSSVDPYYSLQSYAATWAPEIYPLWQKDYWPTSTAPVLIPNNSLIREKGRPSRRIRNDMDISDRTRTTQCGVCGKLGHSRRTCPMNKEQ